MQQIKQKKTQQVKRYVINKIPQMSEHELLMVQSIIQKKLQKISSEEVEPKVATHHDDWEKLKRRMQSKVRTELLYNAIQSRLMNSAHVPE